MGIKRVKQILLKTESKVTLTATAVLLSVPTLAFAAGPTTSIVDSMKGSFEQVVNDTLAGIAAIAPIGITIFGAMFAWKKGKQFFTKLS